MKSRLSIIPLLLLTFVSYSQLWSPNGAKWHHKFMGEFGQYSGYISSTYEKDTIIMVKVVNFYGNSIMISPLMTQFSPENRTV
jgi:hypothetical protein